jgi:hypothetical protein
VRPTSELPWRAYRREPIVLALVALTALVVVHATGPQDITRIGLTRSLLENRSLTIDDVAKSTADRARYKGHYYSDKAPGMSFMAIPSYVALKSVDVVTGRRDAERIFIYPRARDATFPVWFVRIFTGGVLFLITVFLVGRVAEGLVAGTGAVSSVAFGLGTMAGPLGATTFDHGAAGALGFAGFLAAWRALGRPPGTRWLLAGGLCAGFAVFFEYQAALIAALVLAYVLRAGFRPLVPFVAGAFPAVLATGAYNTAAFDSPLRFSYGFVQNMYAQRQHEGIFGISEPSLHGLQLVLVWDRGLLLSSPVLALAVVGLVLLWRRGLRAEAGLAAAVALAFLLLEGGYFVPYGGRSPGPRFFVPALPFLTLGLSLAFGRLPRLTCVATIFSVLATTQILLLWALTQSEDRVLGTRLEVARLAGTTWQWLGVGRLTAAYVVVATALAAVLLAGYELFRSTLDDTGRPAD